MNIEDITNVPISKVTEKAKEKFIQVFEAKFKQAGLPFYEQQAALFNQELLSGPYARAFALTPSLSILNAFMSLAINGLSLERGTTTDCYLEHRSMKAGKDNMGKDVWQHMAVITITGYGEVMMRKRAGQIAYIDNPTVVYDCDDIAVGEENGRKFVKYMKCMKRPAEAKIIACFLKITRPDKSFDYFVMDQEGMIRLKGYSERFSGGRSSQLYGTMPDCGDIDTGFLIAKTIKHAFKGYPKLAIGDGAALEADKDMDEPVGGPAADASGTVAAAQGTMVHTEGEDDPFNQ